MGRISKGEQRHNKFVDDIARNPRKLTFDRNGMHELSNIIMSCPEAYLLHPDTGVLIGKPDVLMMDKYGQFYIIEYKCHGKRGLSKEQLDRNKTHIMRYQPSIDIINIYAHDNYKGEIVK